ncbi:hypothetical protein GS532_22775 [Rhodococcus hoagii]|nr:hypothetical protein [Prescottella equi]MBM4686486.1 hypothetical protein [Prescottella equi]NKS90117.1 hypothetical protein [Prescottella equi]
MPSAEQFIEPRILDNPALRQDTGSKFVVEKFLSAEDTEARAKMWNRIKAS